MIAQLPEIPLGAWAAFLAFVAAMLALDLGVFRRGSHEVGMREALLWCAVWATLALGFAAVLLGWRGREQATLFLTGYLVEISLSMDNVFVFIVLFTYFRVPKDLQHRVLFWGILGAVIMRGVFIAGGLALLNQLHWAIYVLGAFLVFSGVKLGLPGDETTDPSKNLAVRLARRWLPVTPDFVGGRFLVRQDGRSWATPLLLVLIAIETTDVVFAVDSIPAILGITKDGFIVFTSNIFAILGLRSMYFVLAGTMGMFRFLGAGLAVVLVFIGLKMLLSAHVTVPIHTSLAVIGTVLAASVAASVLLPKKDDAT